MDKSKIEKRSCFLSYTDPMQPAEFVSLFQRYFPDSKGVMPNSLRTGNLAWLAAIVGQCDSEALTVGKFIEWLCSQVVDAVAEMKAGADVLMTKLRLPNFRAVLVARVRA